MNSRSSRSHLVFTVHVRSRINTRGVDQVRESKLHLVDLAGSERLNASGSGSDATLLKQCQHINKSLSCLGDVVSALARKEQHIPYRNSKLTYLLRNALGGNCKTLMMCNLSPQVREGRRAKRG